MNKYHIRFNHQHNGSGFVWRVFENGVEYLTKQIIINAPTHGETTIEDGVTKWNICCEGTMEVITNDSCNMIIIS